MSGMPAVESLANQAARAPSDRLFRAQLGRFEEEADRATMDDLSRWVEETYAEELKKRPSKHVYIKTLPDDVIERIDRLRDGAPIRDAILKQFDADSVVAPMKHTDELYISHYNKDWGGDQGLFNKHYDGNLRFLPYCSVVRALIYLQSDARYTVVFGDSRVEKAFGTYEFGLLDFHRELHWVVGEYQPSERQRILLKCNYLIHPKGAGVVAKVVLGLNTSVFYVVKAAMEYSKSPKTIPQRIVGVFCNLFRLMNNVHPIVPFFFIAATFAGLGWLGWRTAR